VLFCALFRLLKGAYCAGYYTSAYCAGYYKGAYCAGYYKGFGNTVEREEREVVVGI
jgi:hypothetical protein